MPGALAGLKVLDFTTLLPGPYATMCLADMGAEVLRIVSRSRPDPVDFNPPLVAGTQITAGAAYLGRNKRCITLNLKDARVQAVIRRLMVERGFDVVIEQFRPGVMGRLNLDYDHLTAIREDVIYCSLTGYGQNGPMASRAGHDINYIARSGIASYSGKKGQGPGLMGMQIADVAAGAHNAVIGVLAAVVSRNATGKGQHIDISMTDGMIAFNALFGAGFLAGTEEPGQEETLLNGGSLYDHYETKDGTYLSFGGLEPQFFADFCRTIGCPELIPGGVAPKEIGQAKKKVRNRIREKTRAEWMALFDAVDACVEPVMGLQEVLNSLPVLERGMVVEVPVGNGSTVRQIANPIKFSETKQAYSRAGVSSVQAHTDEVFRELGYTDEEIGEFAKTGLFD